MHFNMQINDVCWRRPLLQKEQMERDRQFILTPHRFLFICPIAKPGLSQPSQLDPSCGTK